MVIALLEQGNTRIREKNEINKKVVRELMKLERVITTFTRRDYVPRF